MAVEIKMIRVGLTMKMGTLTKWLKKEGDTCAKGEAIAEMETEKLVHDIPAPADGVLIKIIAEEGVEVPVGHLLGYIGEAGEQAPETPAAQLQTTAVASGQAETAAPPSPQRGGADKSIRISPSARKLAEEKTWTILS